MTNNNPVSVGNRCIKQISYMDICLIKINNKINLRPASIHGMLWPQTHFEDAYWHALASKQVCISLIDAKDLSEDALKAGLNVNYLPSFSITAKS